MKILAIGAHPDDIEIFVYGTLAACAARGDEVRVAVATDGGAGGNGPVAELVQQRAAETTKGLAKLGRPHLFGFSDGQLASQRDAGTAQERRDRGKESNSTQLAGGLNAPHG